MATPTLTIVIPTCRRPHFLHRAIESSLDSAPNGNVEVIVVPNGPDNSWEGIREFFKGDCRIHWHPISTPHANAARNHGAKQASGEYIRFLDDDDYLYPDEAKNQLEEMINSGAQISQGNIALVSEDGKLLRTEYTFLKSDFATSMLSSGRVTLTISFIFSSHIAKNTLWDINRDYSQDVAYALAIASTFDGPVISFSSTVGAWQQHSGPRISSSIKQKEHPKAWANLLLAAAARLEERKALTKIRREAALEGIWHCLHLAFPLDPLYWTRFASKASSFIMEGRPADGLFEFPLLRKINPIYIEWLLFPHRRIRHEVRQWKLFK